MRVGPVPNRHWAHPFFCLIFGAQPVYRGAELFYGRKLR